MDYSINDTTIKINHIGINDIEHLNIYNQPLDEYDAENVINHLVEFLKVIAIKENKGKIIIDVHENLRIFNKYYCDLGFITTNNKSNNNPFYLETNLII
jgi:hypothetical protein